jgi:hypothetical protein
MKVKLMLRLVILMLEILGKLSECDLDDETIAKIRKIGSKLMRKGAKPKKKFTCECGASEAELLPHVMPMQMEKDLEASKKGDSDDQQNI